MTQKCEYCDGQGETWRHIAGNSWNSNDPYAWKPQRCEYCSGTGKVADDSESEQQIALSSGLAECFALLEENMQSTNRLWLDMIQEEVE